MHTDEYEISLFREIAVCTAAIKKLEHFLAGLPESITREAITSPSPDAKGLGNLPGSVGWKEQRQALQKWTERKKQYEAMLNVMKISSPS
jgi:hypothetical protein